MSLKLLGKRILVTGAGKGIGRSIAVNLANSGAKVFALGRTRSNIEALVGEYPDITPIVQDLKNWDETRHNLEQLEALDGLVNNAADHSYMAPAVDYQKKELDNFVQNNLMNVINCSQVIAKRMIKDGKHGSIVNISSISSTNAFHGVLGYSMTKAAVDMVTRQFALELGPHNIRVNAVRPTLVMTDIADNVNELREDKGDLTLEELILEQTPMPRLPLEEDIAGPVMYLLSDLSAMVTGTLHLVDAGLLTHISTKK